MCAKLKTLREAEDRRPYATLTHSFSKLVVVEEIEGLKHKVPHVGAPPPSESTAPVRDGGLRCLFGGVLIESTMFVLGNIDHLLVHDRQSPGLTAETSFFTFTLSERSSLNVSFPKSVSTSLSM